MPIARFRLEHHDLLSLENVFLGDAFPHELDTSPLCTRVHVAQKRGAVRRHGAMNSAAQRGTRRFSSRGRFSI